MDIDPRLYAHKMGIDLYEEYSSKEAAILCRVGIGRVTSAKKSGELGFVATTEKRYKFLGMDLVRWKIKMRRTGVENSTSAETGRGLGVVLGTMNKPSNDELQAFALKTFK